MCTLTDGFFWFVVGSHLCAISMYDYCTYRVCQMRNHYMQLSDDLITRLRDDLGVVWDPHEGQ
jgi:hypothetical protein